MPLNLTFYLPVKVEKQEVNYWCCGSWWENYTDFIRGQYDLRM